MTLILNTKFAFQENDCENVGCSMSAILSRPQCVEYLIRYQQAAPMTQLHYVRGDCDRTRLDAIITMWHQNFQKSMEMQYCNGPKPLYIRKN